MLHTYQSRYTTDTFHTICRQICIPQSITHQWLSFDSFPSALCATVLVYLQIDETIKILSLHIIYMYLVSLLLCGITWNICCTTKIFQLPLAFLRLVSLKAIDLQFNTSNSCFVMIFYRQSLE